MRRVSYQGEDMAMLHTAVNSLLGGAGAIAQPKSMQHMFKQAEQPHVTVLFHGSEAHGEAIGKHPLLHATLQAAPASVSLPYVKQGDAGDLRTQLMAHAAVASANGAKLHMIGDCGRDTQSTGNFGTVPHLGRDQRAVIVVCPSNAEDSSVQMAALERLSTAVRQTGLTSLFLFVADPGLKSGASSIGGRSLLAKSANGVAQEHAAEGVSAPAPDSGKGFVCDKKCRTQVNQLEALILFATLVAALGMGMCCLGILDGPSRFESLKEE